MYSPLSYIHASLGMPLAYRQEFSDTLRTIRIQHVSLLGRDNYSGRITRPNNVHLNSSPMQLAPYFNSHEHSNLKCVLCIVNRHMCK